MKLESNLQTLNYERNQLLHKCNSLQKEVETVNHRMSKIIYEKEESADKLNNKIKSLQQELTLSMTHNNKQKLVQKQMQ